MAVLRRSGFSRDPFFGRKRGSRLKPLLHFDVDRG